MNPARIRRHRRRLRQASRYLIWLGLTLIAMTCTLYLRRHPE